MRRHERLIVAAAILALFALWEGLARLGLVDPSLAPAPSVVAAALVRLAGRPEVLASLGVTAWEVAAAFLLATPLGLGLGFLLAEVPALGALFRPLVNFLFGVPKSIFLPVFILVFGVSIPQKIAFGVFTTIFVLIVGGIASSGMGVIRPALTSLITQQAPRSEQGVVLGLTQSLASISSIVSPAIAGVLIDHAFLVPWALLAAAVNAAALLL